MKISAHSIHFLKSHFAISSAGEDEAAIAVWFEQVAGKIAGQAGKLEGEGAQEEASFRNQLSQAMCQFRFLPSVHWLKWLGGGELSELSLLVRTPWQEISEGALPKVSLADSQLLKLLEGEGHFLAEIPAGFARALLHGETWRIHYREALNTSVEVAARTLWEGLARKMHTTGYPVLEFPEAIAPQERLHSTAGPQVRGVVNLAAHIGWQKGMPFLDWKALTLTIELAVRALDKMLDGLPEGQVFSKALEGRRIGIGLVGWADALCQLGIPYEMPEAINLARRLAKFVRGTALGASVALAAELGAEAGTEVQVRGFSETARNQVRTSVLPDEALARIAGTTAGTEPLLGLAGTFADQGEPGLWFFGTLMDQLERRNLLSESIVNELVDHGTFDEETELAEDFLDLFKTREQIPLNKQLQHQTAFGQFFDGPIGQRLWLQPEQGWEVIGDMLQTAVRLRHQALWVASPEMRESFQPGSSN